MKHLIIILMLLLCVSLAYAQTSTVKHPILRDRYINITAEVSGTSNKILGYQIDVSPKVPRYYPYARLTFILNKIYRFKQTFTTVTTTTTTSKLIPTTTK